MIKALDFVRDLSIWSVLIRLSLAMLLGGIMGMERGLKKRPAGFRTYMLVTTGSALVMLTNQYLVQFFNTGDPARLGAQVISGIGFLGAGTIIVTGRNQVKGLTTAAGLWSAACMGLAIGVGFIEIAVIGFLFMYAALTVFHRIDKFFVGRSKVLDLMIDFESIKHLINFTEALRQHKIKLTGIEYIKNQFDGSDSTAIVVTLVLQNRNTHAEVINMLSTVEGIRNIEEIL